MWLHHLLAMEWIIDYLSHFWIIKIAFSHKRNDFIVKFEWNSKMKLHFVGWMILFTVRSERKNSNFTKCNAIFKKKFTEIEFLFSNIKIHPISWALNQSQFKHHSLLFFSHPSDFSELFFLKNGIRFFYSQNHSRMFLLSCEFSFFCSLLIMRQCEFFHISLLPSDKKLSFKLFWMSQMDSHFHFHLSVEVY